MSRLTLRDAKADRPSPAKNVPSAPEAKVPRIVPPPNADSSALFAIKNLMLILSPTSYSAGSRADPVRLAMPPNPADVAVIGAVATIPTPTSAAAPAPATMMAAFCRSLRLSHVAAIVCEMDVINVTAGCVFS